MSSNPGSFNAELFRAQARHDQARRMGQIVDESVERAARIREERAQRDQLEREAEEREERLAYFRALERKDAERLAQRRRLEKQAQLERELEREREQRAQIEADRARTEAMRRHEWEA
ncbi:MAG: hypothetical protein D6695_08375 [Planctomycetota bacterium]|nr:MAG: hypothetical protein D6695_08375 [Planctomycetota bacterium]